MSARLRWALVFGYAAVMAVFSLGSKAWILARLGFVVQVGEQGISRNGVFTLLHLLGFGLLGVLAVNALSEGFTARVRRRQVTAAAALAAVYALALEGLQAFEPSRTVDPLDLVANLLGVALGLAIPLWLLRARLGAPTEGAVEA